MRRPSVLQVVHETLPESRQRRVCWLSWCFPKPHAQQKSAGGRRASMITPANARFLCQAGFRTPLTQDYAKQAIWFSLQKMAGLRSMDNSGCLFFVCGYWRVMRACDVAASSALQSLRRTVDGWVCSAVWVGMVGYDRSLIRSRGEVESRVERRAGSKKRCLVESCRMCEGRGRNRKAADYDSAPHWHCPSR